MMDEQKLAVRLDATPLYEGCGDASDLPERAAAALRRMQGEIERLREHAVTLAETARQVERERCARLCDAIAARCDEGFSPGYTMALQHCAAAIRNSQRPEPSNGWPDTDAERSAGARMCGKCGHPEACAAMGCKTPNDVAKRPA